MYVLDKYIVKRLPFHAALELLTVTLHYGNYRSCLSLFYHPPSSPADILYSLHSYFESINIPQFSSFVLIGDFNINFFDTTHPSFGNLMSTFGLTQVVDNYTHLYQDNFHSFIDLVLLSNPSFLSSCQTIPPLSNSDHLGIWVEIKFKHVNKPVQLPRHSVWHYSQADWDRACERIETFDWDAGMVEDINLSWSRWHTNPKKTTQTQENSHFTKESTIVK